MDQKMNILITGGTGFIGSALCYRLLENKHNIVVLSRRPDLLKGNVTGISELGLLTGDENFDVVINLTGEPIANKRWTEKQKKLISSSRLGTTQKLIEYFKSLRLKPKLFISASAIGYYGTGVTNDIIDEKALGDESFSSQLCQQWEGVALQAQSLGIRTCLLRTGVVLGKGGGALQKMLFPFKLGLGGTIGKGTQWMSWIHLDDLTGIIVYCIDHDSLEGPVNCTAPNPVNNKIFTKALGKVLKRPTFLPVPVVIVKLLMGQMGEELLLTGKKILPKKIVKKGYKFKFEQVDKALLNIV